MLLMNFKPELVLPLTEIVSPVSKTSLPERTFAVSFPGIGKSLTISVVTVTPPTALLWKKLSVSSLEPMFAHCASKITPTKPTGAS